ncbi:hypothetical protein EVJ32_09470 [Exiguobacterium sp. SH5S4]|uniref:hypothetical protein n=1 Tax=Exiguobacterium sp. SH5S4 TaxID=2510961 RepID=UPI00103CA8F3|nr:hypothetical protein [Exiguobacterium sp. SH5S4]TCI25543.1 hypothetical protein EVJ32_09470 [Exiguobacterium sp. SH5S4]
MQTHEPEQLERLYADVNRLVELAADLDDIQQELKEIALEGGKRRGFHSLTFAQNQVDGMVNAIQRQINQLEGGADEISQPAT